MSPAATRTTREPAFVPLLVVAPPAAGGPDDTAARVVRSWGACLEATAESVPWAQAAAAARERAIGAVVVVADGVGADALDKLLAALAAADPALPIVVAGRDLQGAVVAAAFRRRAIDVVATLDAVPEGAPEPALAAQLAALVARRRARTQGWLFEDRPGLPRFIGTTPSMKEVARLVERVAPSEATVLILGESGTGKELVAKALHGLSPRRRGPFVAINCAAIPETLLENELFGHEKGSYTGANATAIGKVEAAEKGTLFLDEIGEMPLPLQSKILRLLQDHTYDRIGGTKTRKADVRIITATNRDLKTEAAAKRFREDLYYRLSVVPILLPALRDRPTDVPVLAQVIVERLAKDLGRPGLHISPEALDRLTRYRWPGNVRELENELERAAVLAGGERIGVAELELRARVEDPDMAALARLLPLDGPLAA
ncbi:MAG: sigma-54 dependent DNA-binding response regulator, partial [Acidobacteria bacterium]|nr:sigma-54 dependent DNA-binding response regulator [Acidobacteriota bacterium]